MNWSRNCKPSVTDLHEEYATMPTIERFKEKLTAYKEILKAKGYYKADVFKFLTINKPSPVSFKQKSEYVYLCARNRCGVIDPNECPFHCIDCCHHQHSLQLAGDCRYATKGFLRCMFYRCPVINNQSKAQIVPKWNFNLDLRSLNKDTGGLVLSINHYVSNRLRLHFINEHSEHRPPHMLYSTRVARDYEKKKQFINRTRFSHYCKGK